MFKLLTHGNFVLLKNPSVIDVNRGVIMWSNLEVLVCKI